MCSESGVTSGTTYLRSEHFLLLGFLDAYVCRGLTPIGTGPSSILLEWLPLAKTSVIPIDECTEQLTTDINPTYGILYQSK